MVYYCQDSLWIKIYIAADDFWWLLFCRCVTWRQRWWKFMERALQFWRDHSTELLFEILNLISLLQRVSRSHVQCSHTSKALCSGCPTFTASEEGDLAQIAADTSLLLSFVPSWWQLLLGQQEGAPAATDGPTWSVPPDGHLLRTRRPCKAHLALLLSAKCAHSALGLQCFLNLVVGWGFQKWNVKGWNDSAVYFWC